MDSQGTIRNESQTTEQVKNASNDTNLIRDSGLGAFASNGDGDRLTAVRTPAVLL